MIAEISTLEETDDITENDDFAGKTNDQCDVSKDWRVDYWKST